MAKASSKLAAKLIESEDLNPEPYYQRAEEH
jgi:hypothetical protein